MKKSIVKTLQRPIAMIASFALAFSMFGCAKFTPVAEVGASASIEEEAAPLAGESTATFLTIKAGAAKLVDGTADTYYFPNLTIDTNNPRKIMSITIQFTSPITTGANGDRVTLNNATDAQTGTKFVVFSGNKQGNGSVNATGGATKDEWERYLRSEANMKITLKGTDTKSIRMIANFDSVTKLYDYNSLNGHYYETVKTNVNWETAFEEAKKKTYMGMQGYLVTVTSQAEHDYVYTMIGTNCWMGLTCWDTYTGPVKNTYSEFYKSQKITVPTTTYSTPCYWFWVSGPEAGKLATYGSWGSQAAAPNPDGGNMYSNWSSGEPNNSSGEFCAHFYSSQSGKWNDYKNTNQCQYVIEYGGMEGDAETEQTSDTTAAGESEAYVKVDIDVDPKGRTITTEAYNIKVGDRLDIRENVNGGEVKTKKPDNTLVNADVTRLFQIKDPTTGQWRALAEDEMNEQGEPFHAGSYKVTSNATYGYEVDGVTPVAYVAGTSTFRIDPKEIDLTKAEKPMVTKVYDGTLQAPAPTLSLAEFVLEDADVTLTTDAVATFNDVSVAKGKVATVTNAVLTGEDAGDYTLKIKDAEKKSMEVKAAITPRDLKLVTTSNVSWGLAGEEVLDASGDPLSPATNLAIHKTTATQWAPNELAWRDAHNLTDTILGELTYEPRCSSTVLDEENPTAGLYTVNTFFANVNPNVKASNALNTEGDEEEEEGEDIDDDETPMASMSLMTEGDGEEVTETTRDINVAPTIEEPVNTDPLDEITVTKLDDGRYDIGNYILSIDNPSILITADPLKEGNYPKVTDFIDGVITDTAAKDSGTMTDEAIMKLVEQVGGEDLPEATPTITITKDGKPVSKIDPAEVGTYAIVATYPGSPDTVVRVAYNIAASEPLISKQSVKVAENDKADPVTKEDLDALMKGRLKTWIPDGDDPVVVISKDGESFEDIDPSEPGTYKVTLTYMDEDGAVREVELTYEILATTAGGPMAQEDIKLPTVDEGDPITKDDLVKKAEDTYGGAIPEDVKPVVTITRDGKPVDAIDPTIPGVYEVTVTYPGTPATDDDPGTEDVVIKTVYTYYEEPKPAAEEPGDGDKTPGDDKTPGGDNQPGPQNDKPEVRVPIRDGAPITKEDIQKEILDKYPDLIPDGAKDVKVTITGPDGKEVESIDPTVPGTYTVTTTYTDDEGVEHTSMTTYTVYDPDDDSGDDGTGGGTDDGTGNGGDDGFGRQAGGVDPSTGEPAGNGSPSDGGNGGYAGGSDFNSGASGYKGWDNASGQKGFADRLLAQTGDPVFWVICGVVVVAVVAGVVLVVARKKNNKQQ